MTRVDFHTHLKDPLGYACRLVRKAYQATHQLIVLGEPAVLYNFNKRLWIFSPVDFIPHCMADSILASETPVVLTTDVDQAPHYQIILNLGSRVPQQFTSFERLIEIISNDRHELAAGRDRYCFYRKQGYTLNMYKQGM
ncbi:DNA polymerase III subunit chi [Candidatus Vallotia tarda]|uniref:DNA polymerase III subunit chi n=1 Tax=Candidatus Vallotiella hemipterorum TaxID=1177213 RepID=A0A916JTX3_9BURK|nr:DNA polymerase III subunit chi [Candidatus Vallotia tarda]CAG7600527.1 DNA polymerase III subunit chi [Candidatus Vallotia tarda]